MKILESNNKKSLQYIFMRKNRKIKIQSLEIY